MQLTAQKILMERIGMKLQSRGATIGQPWGTHLAAAALLLILAGCRNDVGPTAPELITPTPTSEVAQLGPEAGSITPSPAEASALSGASLLRVKDPAADALMQAKQSFLALERFADYEVVINLPVLPTADVSVTVTVDDALATSLSDNNAIVAYLRNGTDAEYGPYLPLDSTYNSATRQLTLVLPAGYAVPATSGNGYRATVKLALARSFPLPNATKPDEKSSGTSSLTPSSGVKLLCPLPRESACIEISRVGPRVGGAGPGHLGIDLRAEAGTLVYAVAPGTVNAPENSQWGIIEIVDGPTKYVYMHLNSRAVKTGDKVNAGDVIGTVGNRSPPRFRLLPHLHLEIWEPVERTVIQSVEVGVVRPRRVAVVSNVDPFPRFVNEVAVDVAGADAPGTRDIGERFNLEIRGYGTDKRQVNSEIDNSQGTIFGLLRKPVWSKGPASELTPRETPTQGLDPLLGRFERSTNPSLRDSVAVVLPPATSSGEITASWEGVPGVGRFVITGAQTAFIGGMLTPETQSTTVTGTCENRSESGITPNTPQQSRDLLYTQVGGLPRLAFENGAWVPASRTGTARASISGTPLIPNPPPPVVEVSLSSGGIVTTSFRIQYAWTAGTPGAVQQNLSIEQFWVETVDLNSGAWVSTRTDNSVISWTSPFDVGIGCQSGRGGTITTQTTYTFRGTRNIVRQ